MAELDTEEDLEEPLAREGQMACYLRHVQACLRSETSGELAQRAAMQKEWRLVKVLKEDPDGWWLRAHKAKEVCEKLGLVYGEPSYYKDLRVWLPDLEFGAEAMPPCVECCSSKRVGVHAFRTNHCARRICDLTDHYFVMSRRYKCWACAERAATAKAAAARAAAEAGLRVEERDEEEAEAEEGAAPQYTYMGYDQRSRALLPFGYGDRFPAFLSHRGGVDMVIVDLMRPRPADCRRRRWSRSGRGSCSRRCRCSRCRRCNCGRRCSRYCSRGVRASVSALSDGATTRSCAAAGARGSRRSASHRWRCGNRWRSPATGGGSREAGPRGARRRFEGAGNPRTTRLPALQAEQRHAWGQV